MYKIMKNVYKLRLQIDFLKRVANDPSAKRFMLTSNVLSPGGVCS